MFSSDTPLSKIRIASRFLRQLKNLKLETIRDLLWHFPVRYEDFSIIVPISELRPDQQTTINGVVEKVNLQRTWKRKMYLTEVFVKDESGTVKAVWFNQPYIKYSLRKGLNINLSGKVVLAKNGICLSNPAYEIVGEKDTTHTGRLVPIYPETRGLTSRGLRYLIKPLLGNTKIPTDFLPIPVLHRNNFPVLRQALRDIHFPDELEQAKRAKRRFAFEDLFLLQLSNIFQKMKLAKQKAFPITTNLEWLKKEIQSLPFELTYSQKKSLWEMIQDIGKKQPMNRLLQGDVGSGKTIVAALASLSAAKNNMQTAFMAPTEILARQHFNTLARFFPNFDQGAALLTSSENKIYYGENLRTDMKKNELLKEIENNKIKIVFGTHALIQKEVRFGALALVIVDEQHRFGVEQRAKLSKNPIQSDSPIPHFLSMSATPIPRTLSLTVFGDLDLSLINELPKNRKEIITKIIAPANRDKAYQFIREQIRQGRQAFVVCPRIEPDKESSDGRLKFLETKSVKEEYDKLSRNIFPDLKVEMLHGKLKSKEKEKIMNDFKEKKIDILVATSVIEVGVDVPNAAIMMIEGAERFGLAQLYQFRGRVGRGEAQSFCFLFTDSSAKSTRQRLKAITEAKNGFELAEKDLEIRGPGEFLGQHQTGMPDLAMKALNNPDLVKKAREEAEEIIKTDPSFKANPFLKQKILTFQKEIHLE